MAKTVEATVNDADFGNVYAFGRYEYRARVNGSAHIDFIDPNTGKEEGCIFVMDDEAAEELERILGSVKEQMRAQQLNDLEPDNADQHA